MQEELIARCQVKEETQLFESKIILLQFVQPHLSLVEMVTELINHSSEL
ncbi:hypothetical protein RintRC_3953 [Richelia intracellularis]|nr:hypothetical protein RintRC_3953 [Richelia intracellularis]